MAHGREFWVRLKPRNEGKGIKLRRYLAFGLKFDEDKRWYRVPEVIIRFNEENQAEEELNVIEYLRQVRNDNDDENSPLAFDICTQAEAQALDAAEKKAKEIEAAKAENPHPIDLVKVERRYSRPASAPEKSSDASETAPSSDLSKPRRGRPPKAKPAAPAAE